MTSTAFITILGDDSPGGTYLLRLRVHHELDIRFGQFQQGEPISVLAGEILYLGSAMHGLANRVLRHCLRTAGKPNHALYEPLFVQMKEAGLVNGRFQPPTQKKLHWHIDYLLDETAVSLTHAILIRAQERLEEKLGAWLLAQPETAVLAPGLGASDVKGHTHLLQVKSNVFWERLVTAII